MSSFYPKVQKPVGRQQQSNQVNTEFNGINALETALSNIRFKNYNEELNRDGYGKVQLGSLGGTAVLADSTIIPIPDPDSREGWLFENTVPGSKYNLYFFDGTQETLPLKDIASVYGRVSVDAKPDNSVMPRLQIYTKPTGVGDAGPFYHSKLDYDWNDYDTVGIGEEIVFWANEKPARGFSNRHLELKTLTVVGDGEGDEEVLYIVLSTATIATTGGVRHLVNRLGFNTYQSNEFPAKNIERVLILETAPTISGGDATAANQVLQLDQETVTASNTSSIDGKITKGNDFTLSEAQQVLVYGEVTSGPGTGELHPIHITNAGDVEVEIADYPRGQQTSADSFPVTIASDQTAITVTETFLRTTTTQTLNVPAGSNAPSSGINMSPGGDPTYRKVAFFGETDNVTDLEIFLEFSNDNANWYQGGYDSTIQLAIDPNDPTRQTYYKVIEAVPQWVRLQKYNSTGSAETLIIKTARIN